MVSLACFARDYSDLPLRRSSQRGFSLIALIGILAVLSIGLALASPAFVQILEREHQETERVQLNLIANGIEQYLEQNKAFPPSLTNLVPDYVPFSSTQVTTNAHGFPRYYVIHPAMAIFSNRTGLSTSELVNARFLLVSNLAEDAAPTITTSSEFETWWTRNESLTPNLYLHRTNFGHLFYSLAITPQGHGGSYFIDRLPTSDAGIGLLPTHNAFHLLGTMIGFDENTAYTTPEVQFALTTNTAYWFNPLCSVTKQWNPLDPNNCGIVTLQDGVGSYTGTRDTYLYEFHYNVNYGTRDELINTDGTAGNAFVALVRFAIFQSEGGPVPDGATIQSAILSVDKFSYYNTIYHAHRVLKDWVETEATWRDARTGVPWTMVGAEGLGTDILATEDGQASAGWNPEVLSFDVTTGVQAFSNGVANYGWNLVVGTGNGNIKRFRSREYGTVASRPKLVIQY